MAEHNVDKIWQSLEKDYSELLESSIEDIGKQELGLIINQVKREVRQKIKKTKGDATHDDFKDIFERVFAIGKYDDYYNIY